MNIFYLDKNPRVAAQFMCNEHVKSKMIVESAQMLANCYTPEQLLNAPKTQKGTVRKYSYLHHGCSKWVKQNYLNYQWLLQHALALIDERKFRFNSKHFTDEFIEWCRIEIPDNLDNDIEVKGGSIFYDVGTQPYLAIKQENNHLIIPNDAVATYRNYYNVVKRKQIQPTWSIRNPPDWYVNYKT